MVENSNIEWTHHTFNPWIGCTKVSPGCDHCYAETFTARFGKVKWGSGAKRELTSDANWKKPLQWNARARKNGVQERVFCASLADVFDNEVPEEWRERLFDLIAETPYLDWLLLTKRVGNIKKMLPDGWLGGWDNVWLGISVVNQEEADRDIPKLLSIPALTRFLSVEPLLGPIDLNLSYRSYDGSVANENGIGLDWVIVGGESGAKARAMRPEWVRSIRDQCVDSGVPFLFKQWGEWAPYDRSRTNGAILATPYSADEPIQKFGKSLAGRMLDGRLWDEYPK